MTHHATETFDPNAICETALAWHRAGTGAVLATVIETWGSAPRPVGSQLAISGAGDMVGSVSGGCVEGAVITEALDLIAAPAMKILEFGVADEDAFAVGLACGGTIRVLLEPVGAIMPEDVLAQIVAARAARDPVAYVVNLSTGARHVAGADAFAQRFATDRSGVEPDGETFVAVHNPPVRLAVIGAVHIAQALLPMARIAGFDVHLIDPRGAFASGLRFPGEEISDEWPDAALDAYGLDARTAVVTLSHDPKLDDPAVIRALTSEAFYVGALGSTRTHAKRVARLHEAGLSSDDIARLHAPVGLKIKAQSPAEIAVSILAQIIAVMRGA
ncbi:XdhC family protein [Celeribacter marinus]|uniref:XdhC family protein n=1 Tax=Celeribacter marinus TaxID=1397108 RepID=UPI003F6D994B